MTRLAEEVGRTLLLQGAAKHRQVAWPEHGNQGLRGEKSRLGLAESRIHMQGRFRGKYFLVFEGPGSQGSVWCCALGMPGSRRGNRVGKPKLLEVLGGQGWFPVRRRTAAHDCRRGPACLSPSPSAAGRESTPQTSGKWPFRLLMFSSKPQDCHIVCGDADHDFNFPETCAARRANWDQDGARHTRNLDKEDHQDASKGKPSLMTSGQTLQEVALKSRVSFAAAIQLAQAASKKKDTRKRERKTVGR